MKIFIDRNTCIGNALCVAIAPEVFDLNDDGVLQLSVAEGEEVPVHIAKLRDRILEAEASCPVGAIRVEE
jgi:ferredoxin